MKLLRSIARFILLLTHIVLGLLVTAVYSWVLRRSMVDPSYCRIKQWWLRRVIHILGGDVRVHGETHSTGVLMVANHISWLDIPLLGGLSPVRFLSKHEVKHWPLIGWLAEKAGTLFIKRGVKGAAQQASDTIAERLLAGDAIIVFPEATTSDGTDVLPFHARLFASACDTRVGVQPVAVRYFNSNGEISRIAPYIDEVSLWDNLVGLLTEKTLVIEVHYLPVIKPEQHSRKSLARLAEQAVRGVVSAQG